MQYKPQTKTENSSPKYHIKTDFKQKRKPPKQFKEEQKLKSLITEERASKLEGSFGKEKEYYH